MKALPFFVVTIMKNSSTNSIKGIKLKMDFEEGGVY